jgi:hypothetical protein
MTNEHPPTRSQRRGHPTLTGSVALGIALVLAGCGSDKTALPADAPTNPAFTVNEFTIKLSQPILGGVPVNITVSNFGGEEHEVVIVKASAISNLPTKPDGSVDEEKISPSAKMGEIAQVYPNKSKSAVFTLAAGSYVAFCNLVDKMGAGSMMGSGSMMGGTNASPMPTGGHVHFARGMYLLFTVTPTP